MIAHTCAATLEGLRGISMLALVLGLMIGIGLGELSSARRRKIQLSLASEEASLVCGECERLKKDLMQAEAMIVEQNQWTNRVAKENAALKETPKAAGVNPSMIEPPRSGLSGCFKIGDV
jgi:hypothetical protein